MNLFYLFLVLPSIQQNLQRYRIQLLIKLDNPYKISKISESDSIFQDEQEEILIGKLKQLQVFKFLTEELITGLRKNLQSL
ncbi:unnamed protein product [Paramecium pentaurelia]|uniref:Uncharacterized protein n=1 Tax=Paramecium pentaurelia TaxID=43138 RepID=A0A8S1YQZ9_9CILI|nr:unnamed protein product [Paramecium pentaurelia]